MGGGSFVAEGSNDGGKKEGERVEGEGHGVETQTVEPAFVVSEGGSDIGPVEWFSVGCVGGELETGVNEGSFGFCEEWGGGGIVVDEEIGEEGDNNGKKSFLYIC